MDKQERYYLHLRKEFAKGRKRPTLWAFLHLRMPKLSFSYRGQRVRFYDDDQGQQYYTYLFGRVYPIGAYNIYCEAEAKSIIDDHLDFIANVETPIGTPNGSVEWQYGKDGKRRIVLRYDGLSCELRGSLKDKNSLMTEALGRVSSIEEAKAELEEQIKKSKKGIDKAKKSS